MKKNVMMRVASIMLVLVLMSSSVISGTFAKYVTADFSEDAARVAKFGVTVDGFSNMFAKQYINTIEANTAAATVVSSTSGKVVAPGTEGTLSGFVVKGTPEVDVEVTYKVDSFEMENWKIGADEYCPIVFTVNTTDYYIGKTGIDDVEDLIAEVTAAIEASNETYQANETLDTVVTDDLTISWKWHFESETEHPLTGHGPACQTDEKDTALGDQAAANVADAATISIKVTCTVTQID